MKKSANNSLVSVSRPTILVGFGLAIMQECKSVLSLYTRIKGKITYPCEVPPPLLKNRTFF